jgi:hypothetical protein
MAEETGGEIVTDFVQTMNNWRRMCQHMEKIGGDRSCDICPLGGCNAIYEDDGNTDYAEIEEKVAAWAAEHKEPVYPSWIDWLMANGVIPDSNSAKHSMESGVRAATFYVTSKAFTPIPADIAQKLGIEPKEG